MKDKNIVDFNSFSSVRDHRRRTCHRGRPDPRQSPETVGNTAGNLNNSGYFCEYDGTVYFANAYDSNTLYSMDPGAEYQETGQCFRENILAGENIFTTTRPELPGMPVSVPSAPFVPLTAVN